MNEHHIIQLGWTNSYLIEGDNGYILIDAGIYGKEEVFFKYLDKKNIRPHDISLIIITHAHLDHVGSLHAIKERCGCSVVIHEKDASLLVESKISITQGTQFVAKLISWLASSLPSTVDYLFGFKPVNPEILVTDEGMKLHDFGFPAIIIPTPGHTPGSISILTDFGDAYVGDIAYNYYPFGLGPYFPPFAMNKNLIYLSWQKILNMGALKIFPSHGKPFDSEILRQKIEE
ncbi:MAG: MBL fold metallo-hydrolase [Desulfobacterales bacterium]|nr:MBL fold metallo-hydrolase [Desulfobacterales bacterium]MBF0395261.1 MBL fold metallo-hydrolase [Desulfobacterales bacterium]